MYRELEDGFRAHRDLQRQPQQRPVDKSQTTSPSMCHGMRINRPPPKSSTKYDLSPILSSINIH